MGDSTANWKNSDTATLLTEENGQPRPNIERTPSYSTLILNIAKKGHGAGSIPAATLVLLSLASISAFTFTYIRTTMDFVTETLDSRVWAYAVFCTISGAFNFSMAARGLLATIPAYADIFKNKKHIAWCFTLASLNAFSVTATLYEERILSLYPSIAFMIARFVIMVGAVHRNSAAREEHNTGPCLDAGYISLSFLFNFAFFLGTTKFIRNKLDTSYHPEDTALSAFTGVEFRAKSLGFLVIATAIAGLANLGMAYLSANSLKSLFGIWTLKEPRYKATYQRKHIIKNSIIALFGGVSAVAAFIITANQFGGISLGGILAGIAACLIPAVGVNTHYMINLLDELFFADELGDGRTDKQLNSARTAV